MVPGPQAWEEAGRGDGWGTQSSEAVNVCAPEWECVCDKRERLPEREREREREREKEREERGEPKVATRQDRERGTKSIEKNGSRE